MTIDKNQAVIDFLKMCPVIQSNPLYFNFGDVADDVYQFNIQANEILLQRPYIDGSVLKRYTCNIDSFKSVAYNNLVDGYPNENVDDYTIVQSIIDWINEQGDNRVFPDFGTMCYIDEMHTTSENPDLLGINTKLNPPMAIYRISIQIDYLDKSKRIWN